MQTITAEQESALAGEMQARREAVQRRLNLNRLPKLTTNCGQMLYVMLQRNRDWTADELIVELRSFDDDAIVPWQSVAATLSKLAGDGYIYFNGNHRKSSRGHSQRVYSITPRSRVLQNLSTDPRWRL